VGIFERTGDWTKDDKGIFYRA